MERVLGVQSGDAPPVRVQRDETDSVRKRRRDDDHLYGHV
jgi:hypothetical protein